MTRKDTRRTLRRLAAGRDDASHELDVNATEARTVPALFVEDARHADHGVGALEVPGQGLDLVHVRPGNVHAGHETEFAAPRGLPRQDPVVMAGAGKCPGDVVPEKSAPADGHELHGVQGPLAATAGYSGRHTTVTVDSSGSVPDSMPGMRLEMRRTGFCRRQS